EAMGIWGDKGQLLSTKGEIFTANLAEAEENGDLPEFSGPSGSEKEVLARFAQFQSWFSTAQLKPESVQLSSRYAWSVKLDNGMNVELGREQDKDTLKVRVQRFISVYPQLITRLKDQIDSVDLRYPNGLALKSSSLDAVLDSQEAKKKKFPRR
ncbi:MAG: cell division protein FtsQ, partial [Burkholderiales bacterium]|nr:cell division protein FtsQ [Burkholderiales bacterium]